MSEIPCDCCNTEGDNPSRIICDACFQSAKGKANCCMETQTENKQLKKQFNCLAELVIFRHPETWEYYLEDIKQRRNQMKDLFQIGLEQTFEEYGNWFYYPFPPVLIISENHPAYDKILDLLDKEKSDE